MHTENGLCLSTHPKHQQADSQQVNLHCIQLCLAHGKEHHENYCDQFLENAKELLVKMYTTTVKKCS